MHVLSLSFTIMVALKYVYCCKGEIYSDSVGSYIGVYDDASTYTWYTAKSYCELVYGTSLASFHSSTEESACNLARYTNSYVAWIGYNDISSEGTWQWSDGTSNDYNVSWNSGEPNDYGGEDCATFRAVASISLNDAPCSTEYSQFICNAPTPEPTINPTFKPTTNPSDEPSTSPSSAPTEPMDMLASTGQGSTTHMISTAHVATSTGGGTQTGGDNGSSNNDDSSNNNSDITSNTLFWPLIMMIMLFLICCCFIMIVLGYCYSREKRKRKQLQIENQANANKKSSNHELEMLQILKTMQMSMNSNSLQSTNGGKTNGMGMNNTNQLAPGFYNNNNNSNSVNMNNQGEINNGQMNGNIAMINMPPKPHIRVNIVTPQESGQHGAQPQRNIGDSVSERNKDVAVNVLLDDGNVLQVPNNDKEKTMAASGEGESRFIE